MSWFGNQAVLFNVLQICEVAEGNLGEAKLNYLFAVRGSNIPQHKNKLATRMLPI